MTAARRAGRKHTTIWLSPELHEKVAQAAIERGVSISYLVEGLVRESIDQLVPADEWLFKRSE